MILFTYHNSGKKLTLTVNYYFWIGHLLEEVPRVLEWELVLQSHQVVLQMDLHLSSLPGPWDLYHLHHPVILEVLQALAAVHPALGHQ